jgi:outer membrane protein OmpA-like peptidoglycan-associated protein
MLKQITLLSICFAASSAFANSDTTLVPFDSVPNTAVQEMFSNITDSSDYIMPIVVGSKGYFTKIEVKELHRDASMIIQPEKMNISISDKKATKSGQVSDWDTSVPKTIVGASLANDTLYIMGSLDNRLQFQQGLLRVTKTATGWSNPTAIKVKGFKPTSWLYGMYMHPTGDVLLIYQKTVIGDNFELYLSQKIDVNTYGKPTKLESINSTGNDITPYLSLDKKRLYFSSNGYNGNNDSTEVENYDLFVSQVRKSDFSELSTPERLPNSINGEKSYEAYVSEIDSNNLIFSSNRNGGSMRLYAANITRGYIEPEPADETPAEVIDEKMEIVELTETSHVALEEIIPEPIVIETVNIVLSSKELNFEFDKYNASKEAKEILQRTLAHSKESDKTVSQIIITGFTDSRGSSSYNKALSKKRAQTMKTILVDMGWSADKIKVHGKGEKNPIADNDTDEGRAKNRRVEFEVK